MKRNQINRLRLNTPIGFANINFEKYSTKKYLHFDKRKSFDAIQSKILNRDWVSEYSFYPFIHFEITFNKFSKRESLKKPKTRQLFYSAHTDSYIYKYYGDLLNHHYNNYLKNSSTNDVATAYRNNLSGKNNIHFAKEVIDFIKKQEHAYIFVADFSTFFDNLDHKYLKERVLSVLGEDRLPPDYYNIFKSITKFSWAEKEVIENYVRMLHPEKKERKELKSLLSLEEFRTFRKTTDSVGEKVIRKNRENYGIPQGSGISAVLSNIYLIDFDDEINNYVTSLDGIYRRYCDDIIIVIPTSELNQKTFHKHTSKILSIKNKIPNLIIQDEKTEELLYSTGKIFDNNSTPAELDYLGFSFDGEIVKIREKSIFKFYNRTYKKIKTCNKRSLKYKVKANRRNLYKTHSHLGKHQKPYGNFISYVIRAQEVFDEESQTKNMFTKQIKNHWKYINKRLIKP